ncbi:MAG: DUF4124 domain-containing protein, partial [Azoarcus sp.]|nr:DUF4124 domain-containing protein [Azoarcus sp.]
MTYKSNFLCIVLLATLTTSAIAQTRVYKCIDSNTGKVTYSELLCPSSSKQKHVDMSLNSIATPEVRVYADKLKNKEIIQQNVEQSLFEQNSDEEVSQIENTATPRECEEA